MLPLPYMMQSHCLSSEEFEVWKLFVINGKYREGVACGSQKLDFKRNTIYGRLVKPVRKICQEHHVLKALATPDVSIVQTLEKVATYRFMTETGGQLKVLVKKKNIKYAVYVEVESLQLCEEYRELVMVWGLFKSDSASFMPLDFQESSPDNEYSTVETPFVKNSVGRLAAELDIDAGFAPCYASFLLKSQLGSNMETSTIRSHRKANFVVPVGFGSGRPFPLGISFLDDGSINFGFVSRSAESVVLCLYTDTTVDKPALEIDLDLYVNRCGDIWHALLDSSMPFVSYGYRCRNSTNGQEDNVLLDPYAKAIEDFGLDNNLLRKCLGKLCKDPAFDWSGESRPSLPMEKLIIYRLNVQNFTKDKSSKLPGDIAGSFSGVSEKLHHFKDLGVNAVLLEPVFPFDEVKGPYYPWHFFSPVSLYGESNSVVNSIKEMVKKMHANGIEVFLEVVFTHTSEVAPLRAIDESLYYKSRNSLNCNHPIVQQMILESLRHWVIEFHIDGFCFINASSLTIGVHGEYLSRPPLIEAVAFDPLLSKVKIIADPWDPHGETKKLTLFPHWKRWAEMNANFNVDIRNFLKGEGPISSLATRLCGSGDLFLTGRGPAFSFNFITRNVGLTLVDLVSFESESELSWNCGEEGPTNKTVVLQRRLKQIRNFLFILFVSLGVPVLNMGDECGQSCGGSLAYGDRRPLDWNALKTSFGVQITQFISFLSALKIRRSDLLQNKCFLKEENIEWHGTDQSPPKWDNPLCKFLAMTLKTDTQLIPSKSDVGGDLFVAFNSGDHSLEISLPLLEVDWTWVCLVDTSLPFPGFFTVEGVPLEDGLLTYQMKAHSCVLFEARSLN